MGHPLVDEFCRAHSVNLKPEFFRRCQRVFRDEINPMLDERDALLIENAELKAQLEAQDEKPKRAKKGADDARLSA